MPDELTLAERVSYLIETVDGSVYAAAKRTGITQPSLLRIATGKVKNPRATMLQQLADAFDVGIEWLLRGTGRGPETSKFDFPEVEEWKEIVRGLELRPETEAAVLDLPMLIYDVAGLWVQQRVTDAPTRPTFGDIYAMYQGDVSRAIRDHWRVYIQLFRTWIGTTPEQRKSVRWTLEQNAVRLRRRFVSAEAYETPMPPAPPRADRETQ
jgi:transcriptional regulator with XRE-family HTH domain